MKTNLLNAALVACVLPTASCGQSGAEPDQSLVGTESLPSPDALRSEVIVINRSEGDSDSTESHSLDYELRPDNVLRIQHTLFGYPEGKVMGKDSIALTPSVAESARRSLWRLRPTASESLGDLSYPARPLNCERQGPHDFGEVQVIFIDERGTPKVEDDRLAQFELPNPRSCNNHHVTKARNLIAEVLQSFPNSRVATDFQK